MRIAERQDTWHGADWKRIGGWESDTREKRGVGGWQQKEKNGKKPKQEEEMLVMVDSEVGPTRKVGGKSKKVKKRESTVRSAGSRCWTGGSHGSYPFRCFNMYYSLIAPSGPVKIQLCSFLSSISTLPRPGLKSKNLFLKHVNEQHFNIIYKSFITCKIIFFCFKF